MTAPVFCLDSTGEVPPAAHHAIGSHGAIRYLSRYSWKLVKRQELVDADRNGLYLGLVYEDGADDLAGGYAVGKAIAEMARKQALDVLGKPTSPSAIIPIAVDADVSWSSVKDGFEGAASVLGRNITGPYGSYRVCAEAYADGFRGIFQTYAWSAGQFIGPDKAKFFQYSNDHTVGGVGCDFDHVYDLTAFWNGPRPVPTLDPRYLIYYDVAWRFARFGKVNERQTVIRYDQLRALQGRVKHPHRRELDQLKAECGALAGRIASVARPPTPAWGAPNWTAFHRADRYRGLIARSKGELVKTG